MVLINAVKDVAKALGDLISATKAAAGKVGDDPAVWQLKNSAKVRRSDEQQEGAGKCPSSCSSTQSSPHFPDTFR